MAEQIEAGYRDVLEALSASRGFGSAEELVRRAVELDPSYTVREILEAPPGGFGVALDAVLHMNAEEKQLIPAAFARTFLATL
jgi:hypothetical protein